MLVLDVDLDFFLNSVTRHARNDCPTQRVAEDCTAPWSPEAVRDFLETRCGLTTQRPVPGSIVDQHHEVYFKWHRLIEAGELSIPFTVIHVDAHADLGGGFGDISPRCIVGDLMHRSPSSRIRPDERGNGVLQPCNFLAFAVICEWITSLTFVLHKNWRDDLPRYCVRGHDGDIAIANEKAMYRLHFSAVDPSCLDSIDFGSFIEPHDQSKPQAVLSLVPCDHFANNVAVDFMFLSKSPCYTPESADTLVPIVQNFMRDLAP
jgi:hypothetical protein